MLSCRVAAGRDVFVLLSDVPFTCYSARLLELWRCWQIARLGSVYRQAPAWTNVHSCDVKLECIAVWRCDIKFAQILSDVCIYR